jgi:ADP-heptose:LPS heptosyltransferase
VYSDYGGLGDQIARLPALRFAYLSMPHVKFHYYIPDYFEGVFRSSMKDLIGPRLQYRLFGSNDRKNFAADTHSSFTPENVSSLRRHLTEYAFDIICDGQPPSAEFYNSAQLDLSRFRPSVALRASLRALYENEEYILRKPFKQRYVVLTSKYTAPVRQPNPDGLNKLAKWCLDQGIQVVWVGRDTMETGNDSVITSNSNEYLDYSVGINLINKTSLIETAWLIDNAECIVGFDNGALHLAGMTDTWIVGAFTSVDPKTRMPYRKGKRGHKYVALTPHEDLQCRFCQSRMTMNIVRKDGFLKSHDFRKCFYEDYQCISQIGAELLIKGVDHVLKKRKETGVKIVEDERSESETVRSKDD